MKHLYYMTYIEPCPSKRTPFSRVMKFTTLVGFSLVIVIYILSLSDLCPGVEMISIEIHKFYTFYHPPPQIISPLEWGVMKFTMSCLLTLKMLQTKFGEDWPSSS